MRFAFIIQGEGRGHQTQAISLSEMLKNNGHEVVIGLIGTHDPNKIPVLLQEKCSFPLETFQSPSLVYDPKTKALSLAKTIKNALPNINKYISSVKKIHKLISDNKVDVIINFYDFLGGIYSGFFRSKAKVICIGHQYLLLNKHFNHPEGHFFDRLIVNLNTKITALGAHKLLALSFSEFPDDQEIKTVPPLLRNELIYYSTQDQGYILVYLTQKELVSDIIEYAERNPMVKFEVFIDKIALKIPNNVNINPISSTLFLDKMSKCSGIISTAGFESVCEAMFLDKPVLMVPIQKHYEQLCNALDAQRAGAGIFSSKIDVDTLIKYLQNHNSNGIHQNWICKSEEIFIKELGLEPELILS
jgi:uncharacterized protein (TIGR00661 family)